MVADRKRAGFALNNKKGWTMKKMRFNIAMIGVSLWIAASAPAASIYWDGGNGTWGDTNNWSTAAAATTPDPEAVPGSADAAIFNITGANGNSAVTLDADREIASMAFTNTGTTALRANASGTDPRTLTLGGNIALNTGAGAVSFGGDPGTYGELNVNLGANASAFVPTNATLTFDGPIGGSNSLTMAFPFNGVLALNRSNAHARTIMTAGNLALGDDHALGTGVFTWGQGYLWATKPVTIPNDVEVNNNTVRFAGTNNITINGSVTLAKGTNAISRGFNTVNAAGSVITLNGNLYMNDVLTTTASSNTMGAAGDVVINGVIADYNGVGAIPVVLVKNSPGKLTIGNSNTFSGGLSMGTTSGTLEINNHGALGTGPFVIGAGATLDNTSGANVTLVNNNPITMVGILNFTGTTNLNLGSGPVTMTGNIQVNAYSNNLTIGGPMSGPYTLTKSQPGTVTLAGANSYTGTTTVSGGALKLGAGEVIPDGPGKGDLSVAAVLDMNGFSETVNGLIGTTAGSINNTATGAVTLTIGNNDRSATNAAPIKNDGGPLALVKIGNGAQTLSASNTFTGGLTIRSGKLTAGHNAALGGGGTGVVLLGDTTGSADATLEGSSTRIFGNPITVQSGSSGLATIRSAGTSSTFNEGITLNKPLALVAGGNSFLRLFDGIVGSNLVTIGRDAGATGWVDLSAINSAFTGDMSVLSNGLLRLGVNATDTNVLPNANNVTVSEGGLLEAVRANTIGGLSGAGEVSSSGRANTLTISPQSGSHTFSGILRNNPASNTWVLSVIKSGIGTQILAGANTYTGATTVAGGTLIVNGDQSAAAGNVTVQSGATLGGTGTVGGATAVSGRLMPGSTSIGTLKVAQNVTWIGAASASADTDWVFRLGAANASDLLDITSGDFGKAGAANYRFDFAGSDQGGTFTLVQWTGGSAFSESDFSYVNLGGGRTATFQMDTVSMPRTLKVVVSGAEAEPSPADIASFTRSAGTISAGFMTTNGVGYRMWYTTNLVANPVSWTEVDDLIGNGSQQVLMDTNLVDRLRIYRVTAE
jgi:autotransporter-associated beta strand protein